MKEKTFSNVICGKIKCHTLNFVRGRLSQGHVLKQQNALQSLANLNVAG
jgi:hypothetical protein